MKTVGQTIKEARIRKRFSREKLGRETKIKKEFIEAIEKESWDQLPEYPVVLGFVKSVAGALDINKGNATALLRRDYPPKKLRVNPKPDVSEKFTWTPRLTFLLGAILVVFVVLAYLGFQYVRFVSAPKLELFLPTEGQVVTSSELVVSGKTDTDSVVWVNNQPTVVDANGEFAAEIEIFEGTDEIEVVSESRAGKITVVKRKIIPKLE